MSAGLVLLPSAPAGVVELCGQVLRFDANLALDELDRRVCGLLDPSGAKKNPERAE